MKKLVLLLPLLAFFLFVTGCGQNPTESGGGTPIPSGPVLCVSPEAVYFNAVFEGSNPSNVIITISNGGTGVLNWSALKTQNWLTLSSTMGAGSSSLEVSANISGLAVGSYHDLISVEAVDCTTVYVPITLEVVLGPPDTPTGLTHSDIHANTAHTSWETTPLTSHYVLSYGTDIAATNLGTVEAGANTFYDWSSLSPNTTYYAKVKACNAAGESPYSGAVVFLTRPATPTGLIHTGVTTNSAQSSWDGVSGATKYVLSYGTDTSATNLGEIDLGMSTSHTFTGLNEGTTYYVKVCAFNIGGSGDYSSPDSFITIPPIPNGLSHSSITSKEAHSSWDSAQGATEYILSYGTDSGGTNLGTISSGSNIYYDWSNLNANTIYYVKVRAKNSSGFSGYSNPASFETLPPPPPIPATPSNLDASLIAASTTKVTWDVANYATEYTVSYGLDTSASDTVITSVSTNECALSSLSSGTLYYVKVLAKNSSGSSTYSAARGFITAGLWAPIASGTSVNFNAVAFDDDNFGRVVGEGGTILRTNNGGSSWATEDSGISQNLHDLFLWSSSVCWAVGDGGKILYHFGGGPWVTQESGTTSNLFAVDIIYVSSVPNGNAIGVGGVQYTSEAIAGEWKYISGSAGQWLRDISHQDTSGTTRWFLVGDYGTILYHDYPYGGNWTSQTSPNTYNLNGVCVSGATVIAVGENGTIIRTTNSGSNWSVQESGTTNTLYSVGFGPDGIWAVGQGGIILRSTDSGVTWIKVGSGTTEDLHYMSRKTPGTGSINSHGWIVGNNGTILKY